MSAFYWCYFRSQTISMLVDGIPTHTQTHTQTFFAFFVIQNVIIKIGANATAINKHFGFRLKCERVLFSIRAKFTIQISVALEIVEKSHEKINLVRLVHFPSIIKFIGSQHSSLT